MTSSDPSPTLQKLLYNHISSGTRRTYAAGERMFQFFCRSAHLREVPATEETILQFVAYLFDSKASFSTLSVYLSAIGNLHWERGFGSPTGTDAIQRALTGYKRLLSEKTDPRAPVTPDIMLLLKGKLTSSPWRASAPISGLNSYFFGAVSLCKLWSEVRGGSF